MVADVEAEDKVLVAIVPKHKVMQKFVDAPVSDEDAAARENAELSRKRNRIPPSEVSRHNETWMGRISLGVLVRSVPTAISAARSP